MNQPALPAPKPKKRRQAPSGFDTYRDAKPTSLSPIALGGSQPLPWMQAIVDDNHLVWKADNLLLVLEQLPPGPELAAGLMKLNGMVLGADNAVRVYALWQKMIAWATAQSMVATAEALESADLMFDQAFVRPPVVIGQEMACATRTSMTGAMQHIKLTKQVSDTLPKSWVALDRGDWSLAHLRALARVTEECAPRVAEQIDGQIVDEALRRGWTPAQVGRRALRLLATIDPEGAADRAKQAKANADVSFTPLPDETAIVAAYGDAATMRRVYDTIREAAAEMRRDGLGDDRSLGQLRVDVLANAVLGEGSNRPAAQALIAVPAGTILGGDEPGELAGYGPVSSATARDLATNAIWRKLILDPATGEALDLGMHSYRPNTQLIRFIRARDWTCRFPGCGQPAMACDCDHRRDHHAGGPTNPANLQLLCRLHHNLKTCKLWSSVIEDDGQIKWISPLGHTYTVEPHRLLDLLEEPPEEPDEPAIPQPVDQEPDPPWPDEPPPISAEDLERYLDAVDELERRQWFRANESFDQFRTLGLIA